MRRTSRNINISTKNKQHSRIAHVRSTEKKKLRLSKFQSFFFSLLYFIWIAQWANHSTIRTNVDRKKRRKKAQSWWVLRSIQIHCNALENVKHNRAIAQEYLPMSNTQNICWVQLACSHVYTAILSVCAIHKAFQWNSGVCFVSLVL